jgi:glycosyltransferase involved in cell wall biosynthesis
MKEITIIITALNEGNEPLKTIESIYDTADPDLFEIILFNDGSDPDKWIDIPAKYKEVKVITNQVRKGIQWCRDEGVRLAETKYIAIFNARMRFPKNWLEKAIGYLDKSEKTLFCTTSVVLRDPKDVDFKGKERKYGAYILEYFKDKEREVILQVQWAKEKKGKCYEIPSVLGANYFTSKKWYQSIGGLKGLHHYGSCEEFLSLKTWAFGGKVKIIKEIEIANIYREIKTYHDVIEDVVWNKLFIAFTLLDWNRAVGLLYKVQHSERFGKHFTIAMMMIIKKMPEIISARNMFKLKTIQNIDHLIKKTIT